MQTSLRWMGQSLATWNCRICRHSKLARRSGLRHWYTQASMASFFNEESLFTDFWNLLSTECALAGTVKRLYYFWDCFFKPWIWEYNVVSRQEQDPDRHVKNQQSSNIYQYNSPAEQITTLSYQIFPACKYLVSKNAIIRSSSWSQMQSIKFLRTSSS